MSNDHLNDDLKNIVAVFFGANVGNLLAEPSRLDSLAAMAGIPMVRVPAIREALTKAARQSAH